MKRLILCAISATALGASLLAPAAMASAAGTDHVRYIVNVTGTIKGGFIETWDDDSVVYVAPLGRQHRACSGAPDLSYCLGLADGRMQEELALKISLLNME